MPANGETVTVTAQSDIPVKVSDRLLKRTLEEYNGKLSMTKSHWCGTLKQLSILYCEGSIVA